MLASVTKSTPACAALVAKVCLTAYNLNGATFERLTAAVWALLIFTSGLSPSPRPGKSHSPLKNQTW